MSRDKTSDLTFLPMTKWQDEMAMPDDVYKDVYMVWSDKPTLLSDILNGRSYAFTDEITESFKRMMKIYLPNDFDWESHIGEFACAVYEEERYT